METLVTLKDFNAEEQHFFVRYISDSKVANKSHYHNYYQLCFVEEGEIAHVQGGNSLILKKGDAFIIPPNFAHSIKFLNESSRIYSLSFDENLFCGSVSQSNAYQFLTSIRTQNSIGQQTATMKISLNEPKSAELKRLLDCLICEQENVSPLELSAATVIVTAIVYVIAQSYYQQQKNAKQLESFVHHGNVLLRCVRYIDLNYTKDISIDLVAKEFALSRASFCKEFPQFTGTSFKKYVSQKRITRAQSLIRNCPQKTLAAISEEVGYTEFTTFYRNFLRITGVSPQKYKEYCKEYK